MDTIYISKELEAMSFPSIYNICIIGVENKGIKSSIQIGTLKDFPNTRALIRILYTNDEKYIDYSNKEILIARTWEEVLHILNFYSKYDYKTLQKR